MDARQKLHLAVIEGIHVNIKEILAVSPSSLIQKDVQGRTVIFAAALMENYEIVDYLLNLNVYCSLIMQEKYLLLRDIVDAGIQVAENHYHDGNAEKAIPVLEKTFFYNKKIVDKEDDDYHIFSYALCLLASIHLKEGRWKKVSEVMQEATFIQKKIIHKSDQNYARMIFCFNALARHYAKERNLVEATKVLLIAKNYCKNINPSDKNKAKLLAVLENNLSTLYQGLLVYEAKLWGFEDKRIKRNNQDSLPSAILDQLNAQNLSLKNNYTVENFSELLNKHMQSFESSYAGDLANKDLYTYLALLVHEGIWTMGHALMVLAFSRALNVNLVIIRYDRAAPIILRQAQPVATLFLGVSECQVYHSLGFRSDWTSARSIQKQLDMTLVDNFHTIHDAKGISEETLIDSSPSLQAKNEQVTLNRRSGEMTTLNQSEAAETNELKNMKITQRKRAHSEVVGQGSSKEESIAKYTRLFKSAKPKAKDPQPVVQEKPSINNGL